MFAFLHIRSGPERGRQFRLDPARPAHIGRGTSCEVLLTDPLSSRFHAVVYFEDDHWHLRDTSSRNGTLVNGQKTNHARLQDESIISIGDTDLQLTEVRGEDSDDADLHQTLVVDAETLRNRRRTRATDPLTELAQTHYLLDLYQLSISLFGQQSSEEVIDTVLKLLMERTSASHVCVYFGSGDGRLTPRMAIPSDRIDQVRVSRRLGRRVLTQNEAIWISHDDEPSLRDEIKHAGGDHWSDVICAPIAKGEQAVGMLQLCCDESPFEGSHLDFAVAACNLLAISLIKEREHESLVAEHRHLAERNAEGPELIGDCRLMTKLKERIARVGRANGSVLIRGESGSGKELVARAVHRASQRASRHMLTVNCAAIPHELIESQLFGHKKGSFTGADADHVGWFQQAHTGTLFLDEIGELPLEGQAKLLRILEGHPFLPVGASEEVLVDVRVIAATNRDLAEFVRDGKFREDLFYRLSVFELLVPPLRDREADLDLLIDHFLNHFRRQHGRPALELSEQARMRMHDYPWPGNVRQLRNVIDSAVVMADEPEIRADDLGMRDAGVSRLDTLRIDEWERRLILKALQKSDGSVPAAAKLLGISRATAYRKLSEYEIER